MGLLMFAGCGEQSRSQPVRLTLSRLADCQLNFSELIGSQPHGNELAKGFPPWLPRSANFASHAKKDYVIRKLALQHAHLGVTNIQVSNETVLSSERVAGTAAGESELTNSLPVSAGASRRESEMSALAFQAGSSDRQTRSLKIEGIGDFARGKVIPRLRIAGKWFERAGFKPGHRVEVLIEEPGYMVLRFAEQGREAAL